MERLHQWPKIFHTHFFWNFLYPTLIGSVIIGIVIAAISYVITHTAIVKVKQRQAAAAAAAAKASAQIATKSPLTPQAGAETETAGKSGKTSS
jgi:hypothetical protein